MPGTVLGDSGEPNSQAPASLQWHSLMQAHFHIRMYFSICHASFRRNPVTGIIFHRTSSISEPEYGNTVLPSDLSFASKIVDI